LPGPHIGKRNEKVILQTHQAGHEVGIHCYDHIRWQDGLAHMTQNEVITEFGKARAEFQRILGFPAKTAGAAGWQANQFSLTAYDEAQLLYGSDVRGRFPFFPRVGNVIFKTLQIPTTLPTLDELLGRPEYPFDQLTDFYLNQLSDETPNVFTTHAEIEGMKYLTWFKDFLLKAKSRSVKFIKVEEIAQQLLADKNKIPIREMLQGSVDGRSGTLAIQKIEEAP
jgi:peptidoglycan/xylan/chitin deacetylase (PgdA/CDA1 family)